MPALISDTGLADLDASLCDREYVSSEENENDSLVESSVNDTSVDANDSIRQLKQTAAADSAWIISKTRHSVDMSSDQTNTPKTRAYQTQKNIRRV